jgi:hypothetical protein
MSTFAALLLKEEKAIFTSPIAMWCCRYSW